MLRRRFMIAAAFAAAGLALHRRASAAEAATPPAGDLAGTGLSEAERLAIGRRLGREKFTLTGDIRRKGPMIVALAVQQGAPWRLVIDSRSGEIVGRRPLAEMAAWPR
jgi:hypothetical protein